MTAWFRMLSDAYGWTPQQIGRLTLPQATMYLADEKGGKGRTITRQEFLRLMGRG